LLQAVAELLAEGLDIRYNQVVTRIEYGDHGVVLHTVSGEIVSGDAAVVTVSLGVLKVPSPPPPFTLHAPLTIIGSIRMRPGFSPIFISCYVMFANTETPGLTSEDFLEPLRIPFVTQEEHQTIFSPPLPPSKAAAIQNLGWGYNEKIFIEFDSADCSCTPPDETPSVAYQLLWDLPWPGPGREEVLREIGGDTPSWAPGIFSFRSFQSSLFVD
jgi:hypothetical protein